MSPSEASDTAWGYLGFWVSSGAGVLALALGLLAWLRDRRSWAHAAFAVGMAAFGAEALIVAFGSQSTEVASFLHWQQLRFVPVALLPAAWLTFGFTYSRGNRSEFLRRWWPLIALVLVVPLGLVAGFFDDLILPARPLEAPDRVVFILTLPAFALQFILIGSFVLVLMNLERTFRAAVGTLRWRIKFVVVGLALIGIARIYSSSQALILQMLDLRFSFINSAALGLGSILIGISFARTHVFGVEVYPSHALLRNSLTVFLVGVYLLVIGVLAKVVGLWGGAVAFPVQAFLLMAGLAGLSLLLMSDRVRLLSHRFVSRHLRRPSHDYREIWHTFTERISPEVTTAGLSAVVVRWIAETFEVLSTSLWVDDLPNRRLKLAGSSAVEESRPAELSLGEDEVAALKAWAAQGKGLANLEEIDASWAACLRQANPSEFEHKGGNRHVLPLTANGEFLGLLVLCDRVQGRSYSAEDCELLKCLAEQIGASLLTIRLSEQLVHTRELETMQTMSTFFAHDLKNTASTLSLMLQNLPRHYDKPEFRADALRSLEGCVKRINDLVAQLAVLRKGLSLQLVPGDVNAVAGAALAPLESAAGGRIRRNFGVLPTVRLDGEQLQKVVTNLVLNALDVIGPEGWVEVSTDVKDGWVTLQVADNGPGMTPEFVKNSLFRPFKTTKKRGLGIGLFHAKSIVEAHGGRIEVASEEGKGTVFRVELGCR